MNATQLLGSPSEAEGPMSRQTRTFVDGLDVTDPEVEATVAVLAVLALQVARTLDRSVVTGQSTSVVPQMARQVRETLAEIRQIVRPPEAHDAFTDAAVEARDAVTPSLFGLDGPAA